MVQDQKTSLWRNIMDNLYLQNNQRMGVLENMVNLDDVMLSRPGGVVRMKQRDALFPIVTPPIGQDAYQMMDYLDQVRAGRVGASPEGRITESDIGDRVGSQAVNQIMTAKEELVGLMIRVIAETCIKPMCYAIRNLAIKHMDVATDYKFRGMWNKTIPNTWGKRSHTTVRVGTGSGDRAQQTQAIMQIMAIQEKLMALPGQALVDETKIYAAVDDFAKFSGLNGAHKYLVSPDSAQSKAMKGSNAKQQEELKAKDDKMQAMQMEFQASLAKSESDKAQAQLQTVTVKQQASQTESMLKSQKQQDDMRVAQLEQQLEYAIAEGKAAKEAAELEYKYWSDQQELDFKYDQLEVNRQIEVIAAMKETETKETEPNDTNN
jgi:hypothetical protein